MAKLVPICLLLSATLLAGCASTNKTSFRNMTAAYRDVVETYSNENVLLNVVRASQRMPLSFLDIPTVIGSGNIATRASLGFRVGNDPTKWSGLLSGTNYSLNNFLTTDTGVTVTNAFTFTQASLDNAAFMKSFLSEITPEVVASLSNNRMVPSMAMYTLLVDSIEITSKDGRLLKSYTNTPLDSQQYAQFQQALYLLVMGGMTTEMATNRVPVTPVFEATEQTIANSALSASAAAGATLLELPAAKGEARKLQWVRPVQGTRICFNKPDADHVFGTGTISAQALCNGNRSSLTERYRDTPALAAALGLGSETEVMPRVRFRSTSVVFFYLGALLHLQENQTPSFVLKIKNVDGIKNIDFKSAANGDFAALPEMPLFVIHKNQRPAMMSNNVTYKGDSYYVSNAPDSWTSSVVVFLSQLLSLNKIAGATPASPGVLVR
jgi:hypothetical protein